MMYLAGFDDSAVAFDLKPWCHATAETQLRSVRRPLRYNINRPLKEKNIVFALPQLDLHVAGETFVRTRDRV